MIALLALGTIGFWVLLFIVGVVITMLVETEHGFFSTCVLALTVLTLNYAYHVPIFASLIEHPSHLFGYAIVYVFCGMLWGLMKWFMLVHDKLDKYTDYKADFLHGRELTPELASQLVENLKNHYHGDISIDPPEAKDYKSNIIRWMTYWPFSVIGSVLNDFVRKIFNFVYRYLLSVYEKISNHIFRNVKGDLEIAGRFKATRP